MIVNLYIASNCPLILSSVEAISELDTLSIRSYGTSSVHISVEQDGKSIG